MLGFIFPFAIIYEAAWTLGFFIVTFLIGFSLIMSALAKRAVLRRLRRRAARRVPVTPPATAMLQRAAELEAEPEPGPAPAARAADRLRARADELDGGPLAQQREREARVAALFSVSCPEETCGAAPGQGCVMGIAVPVALVRSHPVAFCHLARMAVAVAAGAATQEEVDAQFSHALVPEPA
jgi:hypothetical protein